MFLNYQKFSQILSSQANYSGDIQLILETEGLKEKVVLLIAQGAGLEAEQCREVCLKGYHDLEVAVDEDKTLLFEVRVTTSDSFARSPGSGKLKHIIDRRTRA